MNTLITPLCKEAGNPIRVSKEPRVPGKEKKIDVKIQQPRIKKKKRKMKAVKTFCLFLWKINRKKYCVLDKTDEISEQDNPQELTIPGSEGDLNRYEPRALPSTQVIPAASSASGHPAYTSTPLTWGKYLLEAACSISGKEAISCLLPTGHKDQTRAELLLKTTHHREVRSKRGGHVLFATVSPTPRAVPSTQAGTQCSLKGRPVRQLAAPLTEGMPLSQHGS